MSAIGRVTVRRAGWPLLLGGASLVVMVAGLAATPPPDPIDFALTIVLYPAAVGALIGVGALLVQRVPANVVGWLLYAAGLLMSLTATLGTYASLSMDQPQPWPGTVPAAVLNQVLFIYPFIITLVVIPLYFPTGRLPGRRWRLVVLLVAAALAATTIADLLRPMELVGGISNPLGSATALPISDALSAAASLASVAGFAAALAAIAVRYRRGADLERLQLRWLLAVAGFAAVVVPLALLVPDDAVAGALFVLVLVAFISLPVAIGIAVLRYRLYEIDRIISRTIGWVVISGSLGAVFACAIVGLQGLLAPLTSGSTLAVAGSTLLVATLFQPVRRQVQQAVDRRFDRARYDGQRTADAFATRLRDQVDLSEVERVISTTVDEVLRPGSVALWVRREAKR